MLYVGLVLQPCHVCRLRNFSIVSSKDLAKHFWILPQSDKFVALIVQLKQVQYFVQIASRWLKAQFPVWSALSQVDLHTTQTHSMCIRTLINMCCLIHCFQTADPFVFVGFRLSFVLSSDTTTSAFLYILLIGVDATVSSCS